MLNYVKTILLKVSFDKSLFEKEVNKSLRYLIASEIEDLRAWCMANFGTSYVMIIDKAMGKGNALASGY
jgi:hypothetical protein